MSLTTFSFPTPTCFGVGSIKELPARLQALNLNRPLVVTDPGLLHTEAFDLLRQTLGKPEEGSKWFVFAGAHPNPVEKDVEEGADAYRKNSCDGVIAFGGGSALDVGKAVRLLVKRPDLKLAQFNYQDDWRGLAPCVCIPTTPRPAHKLRHRSSSPP